MKLPPERRSLREPRRATAPLPLVLARRRRSRAPLLEAGRHRRALNTYSLSTPASLRNLSELKEICLFRASPRTKIVD